MRLFNGIRLRTAVVAALATGFALAGLAPAQASADALVRFVHAVPGVGEAQLVVDGGQTRLTAAIRDFGQASRYRRVPTGDVSLSLKGPDGKVAARLDTNWDNGERYTVVAILTANGVTLRCYEDRGARPEVGLLRLIHAAPELGSPDVDVDGKRAIQGFRFGAASPYVSLSPTETHSVAAMRPGKDALLTVPDLRVQADSVATAFIVGTRGERVRALVSQDDSAPVGARMAKTKQAATSAKKQSSAAKQQTSKAKTQSSASKQQSTSGAAATSRLRGVHVVQPGESIWRIVRQRLGAGASNAAVLGEVERVWQLNSAHVPSGDPDLILPGLRLKLR